MKRHGGQLPEAGTERVVILGGGALGAMAADLCAATGREVVGFLDNRKEPGSCVYGTPILGPFDLVERDAALRAACHFIVAVSDALLRLEWLGRIAAAGARLITLIHPSVACSPSASLGDGIMILPFTTIYPGASIGEGCLIEGHAGVGPEVSVMPVCMLAESSVLGHRTHIGAGSFIGAGAVTRPHITIGEGCLIGANSTVIRDIPPFKVAAGSPARVLRDNVDLDPAHAERTRQNR
ncbi:NeuD/PglB/VioB family sugar acetyltransferase [Azospirillum sp. B506]|uniref:NeuD/PglB/VioB family sugar acetyltransferase n=1 Tax=Azospirillum sp. B506 TaxID=137721 RepID=UPI00034CB3AA|nr:NeuD/PglB/VioB family sugar acetyltransferase [Azospirillum sp. B506]